MGFWIFILGENFKGEFDDSLNWDCGNMMVGKWSLHLIMI